MYWKSPRRITFPTIISPEPNSNLICVFSWCIYIYRISIQNVNWPAYSHDTSIYRISIQNVICDGVWIFRRINDTNRFAFKKKKPKKLALVSVSVVSELSVSSLREGSGWKWTSQLNCKRMIAITFNKDKIKAMYNSKDNLTQADILNMQLLLLYMKHNILCNRWSSDIDSGGFRGGPRGPGPPFSDPSIQFWMWLNIC